MSNHTTAGHREFPGKSAPRAENGEEVGVFTCYSAGTSFVDGAVSINNGGKNFFVNSKLLVDNRSAFALRNRHFGGIFCACDGGDVRRLEPSNLPNASGKFDDENSRAG